MKTTIKIPKELSDYIESLHYETMAAKDVVVFMVRNKMVEDTQFDKYNKLYTEAFAKYDMAKQELENTYVKPNYPTASWSLDFNSQTLEIEVPSDER